MTNTISTSSYFFCIFSLPPGWDGMGWNGMIYRRKKGGGDVENRVKEGRLRDEFESQFQDFVH